MFIIKSFIKSTTTRYNDPMKRVMHTGSKHVEKDGDIRMEIVLMYVLLLPVERKILN